ncbi:(E)-4-hydroxy-3-methylbut-2-enyl-diphosphate synthase [Flexibacter flexilis DSM 6793]|uniref:4-hydroxy-3-methylbut-2-en-1-yl diphosphate synthase (flavodoxin) n=1 Tax=Flexibacter flexilis DSM 6793 TaxID=927664 RepID=A0A1I1FZC7_9BACT|nr:(E)-4-hydroxy-3-methylbut-2-enyl-diphosphate synthase [Flexibacter flexilis]SFC04635.1 (E)-4-hydroxy-3-methylbut-2-enyl-diphosphate synthase [Flexibacter flexilis DSM 6793]
MNKTNLAAAWQYCESLTAYHRRLTQEVKIGDVPMGAHHPIRVQSMTTVDTMDTAGSVAQCIRMIEAGCEYIRITAPSLKEAENLGNIKAELRRMGYNTPLVADIHFTPNAAELAARLVEKVRINPGNYADKKRFETIDYTDATYAAELERIRERFVPLVNICKEYGTAMRIGTNHGSLSDRILSRYGDTPLGMVESALEFLRICEAENYYNIVISMKASNTQVMVQAYRLLVQKLAEENLKPYPLHLGVTEAGEGEDGRIKSAVGIGTLLEDGLGDTIRVSLTEEPELEIPVARALADRYTQRAAQAAAIPSIDESPINPFQHIRRHTREVLNIGGGNVPRVVTDISQIAGLTMDDLKVAGHFYLPALDKWKLNDLGADYLYSGQNPVPFMLANGSKEILDYGTWLNAADKVNKFPLFDPKTYFEASQKHEQLNFIKFSLAELNADLATALQQDKTLVAVAETANAHAMPELRRLFVELMQRGIDVPVITARGFAHLPDDEFQLYAATDVGGLLIDGLGDGAMIRMRPETNEKTEALEIAKNCNNTAFGILQAARTRMSKAEYISCPSCGRTLFDLQETTAMIRKRTDHLKGIKIGIMGCIVNGPGEMADADYGYVGVGKGKIALYRGQDVVKKAVPAENAVDELIEIIREDGKWISPEALEE